MGDSFGRARSIETPDGPCRWPVGGEKTRTVIPLEKKKKKKKKKEGSLLSVAQHAFGPCIEVTKRAMRDILDHTQLLSRFTGEETERERRTVLRYRGFASTVAPLASRLEKMTSNSRPRLNDQDDNDEDHDCSKLGWIRSLSGARLKQGGVGVAELEDGARLATTGSCCVKVKRALLRGVGRRIMVLYIDATGSHFPSILLLQ